MKPLRALAALSLLLCLGAAKKPLADVRVHAQGTPAEAPTFAFPTTLLNGTPIFLQRMPLISSREITSVYPFPAPSSDGTRGAYLKLDNHGSQLLQQHTMDRRGTVLVVMVNGRQACNVLIDRAIDDGIVAIPRGLTDQDVAALCRAFPVMGDTSKKKGR